MARVPALFQRLPHPDRWIVEAPHVHPERLHGGVGLHQRQGLPVVLDPHVELTLWRPALKLKAGVERVAIVPPFHLKLMFKVEQARFIFLPPVAWRIECTSKIPGNVDFGENWLLLWLILCADVLILSG